MHPIAQVITITAAPAAKAAKLEIHISCFDMSKISYAKL